MSGCGDSTGWMSRCEGPLAEWAGVGAHRPNEKVCRRRVGPQTDERVWGTICWRSRCGTHWPNERTWETTVRWASVRVSLAGLIMKSNEIVVLCEKGWLRYKIVYVETWNCFKKNWCGYLCHQNTLFFWEQIQREF